MPKLDSVTVVLESLENIVINVCLSITPFQWMVVNSVTVTQLDQPLLNVTTEGNVLARTTSKAEDVKDAEKISKTSWQDVLTVLSVTTSFKMQLMNTGRN
jgi:hypothetical protein